MLGLNGSNVCVTGDNNVSSLFAKTKNPSLVIPVVLIFRIQSKSSEIKLSLTASSTNLSSKLFKDTVRSSMSERFCSLITPNF